MKKAYLNIVWALAFPVLMGSCSEEDYSDADINGIPQVEALADAISINIDQNTNAVTFEIAEDKLQGYYPTWIFGEGATDATVSTTKSRIVKTYPKRGDYTVSVKLGNKNGLSDGVINKTFHINNTLVEESFVKALTANPLYWYYVADGHFGCGSPNNVGDGYGLDWWSCSANGKGDSGMYDDVMTFSTSVTSGTMVSGTFEYDPGEDGKIHCNSGVNFAPFGSSPNGNDFDAPATKQTSTWKLYYDEQDVLWLELAPQTQIGYVAGEDFYNAPKFRVMELTDKKLSMVCDNGGIAWRYVFCPQSQNEVDDIGGDKYATAIIGTWMMSSGVQGHLGCGENTDNATGWWSAGPNEKSGFGVYDDVMTYEEDGTYIFDPGEEGTIYCNKACTYDPAQTNDADDYVAAASKQTATWEVINEGGQYYLVLPANTLMSYMPDDAVYQNPKYLIYNITKDGQQMTLRSIQNGISWNFIFKKVQ